MSLIALLGGIRATVFAGIALLALLLAGVQTWRLDSAQDALADMALQAAKDQAAIAAAQVEASESARQVEHEMANAANAAAASYEQGKRDAEQAARVVVAGLRAGNLRLRDQWQGCKARGVPGVAGAASEPDAASADRNDSAGRIIGAGAACDAQVIGLQELIRAYRSQ